MGGEGGMDNPFGKYQVILRKTLLLTIPNLRAKSVLPISFVQKFHKFTKSQVITTKLY